MVTTPGLKPFREDRPDVDRADRAIPIPESEQRPQRLQPVARPVDTYARPAPVPRDNDLTRLADSLSSLVPTLTRFGEQNAAVENENAEGNAIKRLAGKTPQEQRALIDSDPMFRNALAKAAGENQYAIAVAEEFVSRKREEFATGKFNPDTGDFNTWFNEGYQDVLKNVGPQAAKFFMQRLEAGRSALNGEFTKYRSDRTNSGVNDTIVKAIDGIVGAAIDGGQPPEQAHLFIRGQMQTNNTLAGKTFPEQEAMLLQVLKARAAMLKPGSPEFQKTADMIVGIISADRGEVNGQKIGSLLNSASVGGEAAKIVTSLQDAGLKHKQSILWEGQASLTQSAHGADPNFRQKLDEFDRANPGILSGDDKIRLTTVHANATRTAMEKAGNTQRELMEVAQRNALVGNAIAAASRGELYAVEDGRYVDKDGREKVMSADDIRKEAVTFHQKRIAASYGDWRNERDPQARVEKLNKLVTAEAELFQQAMVPHERLKVQLNSAVSASTKVVQANGDIPPIMMESFELYRTWRDKAPQMVTGLLTDKNLAFYEMARSFMESGAAKDEREALILASRGTADPNRKEYDLGGGDAQFTSAVSSALNPTFGTNLTNKANSHEILMETRRLATAYHYADNVSYEDAAKKAAAVVRNNYIVVGNSVVRTGGMAVPPRFEENANKYVEWWKTENKENLTKLGIDPDRVSVKNVNGSNAWVLWDTENFRMIDLPNSTFSADNMMKMVSIVRQKEAKKALEDEKTKFENRFDPVISAGPFAVYPFWRAEDGTDTLRNTPQQNREIRRENEAKMKAAAERKRQDQSAFNEAAYKKYVESQKFSTDPLWWANSNR